MVARRRRRDDDALRPHQGVAQTSDKNVSSQPAARCRRCPPDPGKLEVEFEQRLLCERDEERAERHKVG